MDGAFGRFQWDVSDDFTKDDWNVSLSLSSVSGNSELLLFPQTLNEPVQMIQYVLPNSQLFSLILNLRNTFPVTRDLTVVNITGVIDAVTNNTNNIGLVLAIEHQGSWCYILRPGTNLSTTYHDSDPPLFILEYKYFSSFLSPLKTGLLHDGVCPQSVSSGAQVYIGFWMWTECGGDMCAPVIQLHHFKSQIDFQIDAPNSFLWLYFTIMFLSLGYMMSFVGCVIRRQCCAYFCNIFGCNCTVSQTSPHDTISSSIHDGNKLPQRAFNLCLTCVGCIMIVSAFDHFSSVHQTWRDTTIFVLSIAASICMIGVALFPGGEAFINNANNTNDAVVRISNLHKVFAGGALCSLTFVLVFFCINTSKRSMIYAATYATMGGLCLLFFIVTDILWMQVKPSDNNYQQMSDTGINDIMGDAWFLKNIIYFTEVAAFSILITGCIFMLWHTNPSLTFANTSANNVIISISITASFCTCALSFSCSCTSWIYVFPRQRAKSLLQANVV
jgi:hypothetical protein